MWFLWYLKELHTIRATLFVSNQTDRYVRHVQGLEQGSPNCLEIGPHGNIENYGRAGYNILYGNYINNTLLYDIII